MDFFKWLANQPKMTDPHANAQALLSGTRMFGNTSNTNNTPGGYDPNGADITGNTQALLDPKDLVQNVVEPKPIQSLLDNTNNTTTNGVADLGLDTTNDLTNPVNESTYKPTQTNIGPSLLITTPQQDKTQERLLNDISNQAVLDNGQRIGQEPLFETPSTSILAKDNPVTKLMEVYGGNRDMALIADKMGTKLMDALLAQYGVKWKDYLADHLKQYLLDNRAW